MVASNDSTGTDTADPVGRFFTLLAGNKFSELQPWIENNVDPLAEEGDERVLTPEFCRKVVSHTIHRYGSAEKKVQRLPLRLIATVLAATGKDTRLRGSLIEAIVKTVDQEVCRAASKSGSAAGLPLSSVVYAMKWVDECIWILRGSTPVKLFGVHCTLAALAVSHPEARPGRPIPVFKKFFWHELKERKEFAQEIVDWVTQEKLGNDTTLVHGALLVVAHLVQNQVISWNSEWNAVILKHFVTCKLPVPVSIMERTAPIICRIPVDEVLQTSEKLFLRSPEVVLPFVKVYFATTKHSDVQPGDFVMSSVASQLNSSNEQNVQFAIRAFGGLWRAADQSLRDTLVIKALDQITKCSNWQAKLNVYSALKGVALKKVHVETLCKNVKAEANDTVALFIYELLLQASKDQSHMDLIFGTWTRVNPKIRKQFLTMAFEQDVEVPVDKLSSATDPVALALIFRQGAFNKANHQKKVAELTTYRGHVDAAFVFCVDTILGRADQLLNEAQLRSCVLKVLPSPEVFKLTRATHPVVYKALNSYALPLKHPFTLAIRKHFVKVLHHLKSADTLLDLLIYAHHPSLPDDMWPSLAFHCHVSLDEWLHPRNDHALEIVCAALESPEDWMRQAALRAASTIVWVDDALSFRFAEVARKLLQETLAEKERVAKDSTEGSPTPTRATSSVSLKGKVLRPGSAGSKPSAGKGTNMRVVKEAETQIKDHTSIVLGLICAITKHGSMPDSVAPLIVELMKKVDQNHSDIKGTWECVCECIDPSLSAVRSLLVALLSGMTTTPTVSQDELASSLLFQLAYKTMSEPLSPAAFLISHEVMTRVFDAAVARTRTSDKVVLDRILDHVTFFVDIVNQHGALGFSTVMPVTLLMKQLVTAMSMWKKQTAAKAHEALVSLVHSSQQIKEEQLRVLMDGCMSGKEAVVEACLEACQYVKTATLPNDFKVLMCAMSCHTEYGDLAQQVLDRKGLVFDLSQAKDLVLQSELASLASCSASCFLQVLEANEKETAEQIQGLHEFIFDRFKEVMHIPKELDEFGMLIKVEKDTVTPRLGLLECLASAAPFIPCDVQVLKQWIPLLNDPIQDVHGNLLNALRIYVRKHGEPKFVPIIRGFANHQNDDVREAMVILLGECAQHLSRKDPLLEELLKILLDSLRTPSESVQMAVAQCLPALPCDSKKLFSNLLKDLFTESKYGLQRGCAYGLAGLAKGNRALLKEFKVIKLVDDNLAKKDLSSRQGALLLLETCTLLIGRMFEPYLIKITPSLLALFSDVSKDVRQATMDASRAMMQNISSYAVKLLMPKLMDGLRSDQWRTKKASIELLASMAYCPPEQLSNALPMLVPSLLESLADSHMQVSKASKDALGTFGSVITNPEVQLLVPCLLDALVNESKVLTALTVLSTTTFEHYLDAPSLALIAPLVRDGLRGRQGEQKCAAAQILGNLTTLSPKCDFLHYLHDLLPSLLNVLADAVPKTRSMAARTLGILVRSLGKEQFPELVPQLFLVLNQSTSSVDKSGAAQGLSEVLAALGVDQLDQWTSKILEGLHSPMRDGYLVLLVFLPVTFGAAYKPFIPKTLASVLNGLADESEMVRDSALRAAQIVIDMFNDTAIDLLLPELIRGVCDPSWRIRQSSVQLLGDLLTRIMGHRVKPKKKDLNDVAGDAGEGEESETESDDDQISTLSHSQQIKILVEALGLKMYQETLASLYILRSDSSGVVRQTAMNVWRMLVSNTPRQIKEILPVLLRIVLGHLSKEPLQDMEEEGDDIMHTAAQTLGDIVRKLGESILAQMLPILREKMEEMPRGVCLALVHVVHAAGRQHAGDHMEPVVQCVAYALKHEDDDVREAGAALFDELMRQTGNSCIDAVLLPMLEDLPDSLSGLQHVMAVRGHIVMPVLLPSLLAKDDAKAREALTSLLSVSSLGKKSAGVLDTLLSCFDVHVAPAVKALLSHPFEEEDIEDLNMILEKYKDACLPGVAIGICSLAPQVSLSCKHTWLSWLLQAINVEDDEAIAPLFEAMNTLVRSVAKDELDTLVVTVANGLAKYSGPTSLFSKHTKGPAPVLTIVLHAIMYGVHKEQAVRSLIQIIQLTPGTNLKPHVTAVTGPLIRILGDRTSSVVKALILEAVFCLLSSVGPMLKPFIPQLSRTLLKQLENEDERVIMRARDALCLLIALHPRPEALVNELCAVLTSGRSPAEASAAASVLAAGVKQVSDPSPIRKALVYIDAKKKEGDAQAAAIKVRELSEAIRNAFGNDH